MSVTVHFKDSSTNKTTSPEYQMGAVIPELGDYIVSPFNADRIALVHHLTKAGFNVYTLAQFDDFDKDKKAIDQNFQERAASSQLKPN